MLNLPLCLCLCHSFSFSLHGLTAHNCFNTLPLLFLLAPCSWIELHLRLTGWFLSILSWVGRGLRGLRVNQCILVSRGTLQCCIVQAALIAATSKPVITILKPQPHSSWLKPYSNSFFALFCLLCTVQWSYIHRSCTIIKRTQSSESKAQSESCYSIPFLSVLLSHKAVLKVLFDF